MRGVVVLNTVSGLGISIYTIFLSCFWERGGISSTVRYMLKIHRYQTSAALQTIKSAALVAGRCYLTSCPNCSLFSPRVYASHPGILSSYHLLPCCKTLSFSTSNASPLIFLHSRLNLRLSKQTHVFQDCRDHDVT